MGPPSPSSLEGKEGRQEISAHCRLKTPLFRLDLREVHPPPPSDTAALWRGQSSFSDCYVKWVQKRVLMVSLTHLDSFFWGHTANYGWLCSHLGSCTQKGPMLGLILCCHCFKTFDTSWTRDPIFSFCMGLGKWCNRVWLAIFVRLFKLLHPFLTLLLPGQQIKA